MHIFQELVKQNWRFWRLHPTLEDKNRRPLKKEFLSSTQHNPASLELHKNIKYLYL